MPSRARFQSLLEAAEENCLVVIVGMKLDLLTGSNRAVSASDGKLLAKELNKQQLAELPYFETSSLTGHNVDRVFEYIFQHCLPLDSAGNPLPCPRARCPSGTVDLGATKGKSGIPEATPKSGCC